ncbi:MAG: FHA domain-containing protein [Chloroflexus sp.]
MRRHPLLFLLMISISWLTLVAATFLPPAPSPALLPLILGVERISATTWALLVRCHYQPRDVQVWVEATHSVRPKVIEPHGARSWRAQFDGHLPSTATVYGCGQSATLVVTTPNQPGWIAGMLGLTLAVTGILAVSLIRRRSRQIPSPARPPSTIAWRALIHDEQGERSIALPTGIVTVGSDPACQLIVLAPDIALRHAQIMVTEATAHIVDLASPSGIFSGPVRRRLRPHTPIPIGDEDLWLGATVRMRLAKMELPQCHHSALAQPIWPTSLNK